MILPLAYHVDSLKVERALDRDRLMTADEAAAWGLIERVLRER
ncbi:ATP-dependent Clp protease proteolytic subunit [Enterobacter ludwigii]